MNLKFLSAADCLVNEDETRLLLVSCVPRHMLDNQNLFAKQKMIHGHPLIYLTPNERKRKKNTKL